MVEPTKGPERIYANVESGGFARWYATPPRIEEGFVEYVRADLAVTLPDAAAILEARGNELAAKGFVHLAEEYWTGARFLRSHTTGES